MIFDMPTSAELVEAVAIFLEEKIKDNLPNHLAFNTQIAINILNIVKRELEQGDKLSEDSKEILINLMGDSKKARKELNWRPKININGLVKEMVDHELKKY